MCLFFCDERNKEGKGERAKSGERKNFRILRRGSLRFPYFFLTFRYYSIGGSSLRKIAAAHQQVKSSTKDDSLRISKVSQSCQAGSCVDYCESCTLAGEAILHAINSIEQVFVENKLISVSTTERWAKFTCIEILEKKIWKQPREYYLYFILFYPSSYRVSFSSW